MTALMLCGMALGLAAGTPSGEALASRPGRPPTARSAFRLWEEESAASPAFRFLLPMAPAARLAAAAKKPRPFYGLRWDEAEPVRAPDCSIAKGPVYTVQAVNSRLTVLDERGRIVLDDGAGNNFRRFSELFASLAGTEDVEWYGPRCLFDEEVQRYFIVACGADFAGRDEGWLAVAVSAGANPLEGAWTVYGYRTDLTGTSAAVRWPESLGAGTGGDFLVASWNDYAFGTDSFEGCRLGVFNKSGLVDGSDPHLAEVNDLRVSGGTPAFGVVPCRHHGANSAFYLVSSEPGGGASLELWRLTGTPRAPELASVSVPGVLNYQASPNGRQPGVPAGWAADALELGDCRVRSAVADNDRIWTALNTSLDGVVPDAAIHLTELDGVNGTVLQSQAIGARGTDYFLPAVDTTRGRKPGAVVVFGSSSRKTGAGLRYCVRLQSMRAGKFRPSKPLIKGNGKYDPLAPRDPLDPQPPPAWASYFSAVRDPARPQRVLVAGTYADAKKSRSSRAWATRLKFIKP